MISQSKFNIWIMASRPKTLPAAITPVLVGSALAQYSDSFKILPALSCILGALLLQIAANMANDYYDFKKGTDPIDRIGPIRVTASGLLSPRELISGLMGVLLLSVLNGLYLIWIGGIVILIIGIMSIASLMAYSGLRVSYGYHGFGDIFVFVFFGLLAVNGTYFVQVDQFDSIAIWSSLPSGFLITAILVVNNYRDIDTDAKTGKRTLAVILGRKNTRKYFQLLFLLSYLDLVFLYINFDLSEFILLPFLTIPLSYRLYSALSGTIDGPKLNIVLADTAKLGLYFSLLFSLGFILP
ncbi:MAG: 1,4-dihydroxy-2-naphthoate octaprenyltransferase [Candidatus Heimdallarchaeota archaeon LC_2]|nr:MAG: 1,4-dihydroxy-2-naphthoate octaprenyltransferase [Candidatus Heimdallarchaeota archaeon LC_2]